MKSTITSAIVIALLWVSGAAQAAEAGDWVVRLGLHDVNPKGKNGTLANTFAVDVDDSVRPTVSLEYFLTGNWGIAVLGAIPFEHDFSLNGTRAGSFIELPPTVTFRYHLNVGSRVSPFFGLGANYTLVYGERPQGPVAGSKLSLGNSLGPVATAGIDFRINERWLATVDVLRANINSDAKLNGQKIGTVHVDPLVYGVTVGYQF